MKQPAPALVDRVASSSVGALVTSLAVTPLEVVKVRLQTQSHLHATTSASGATTAGGAATAELLNATTPNTCARCTDVILDDGLMDRRFPKHALAYRCRDHVRFTGPTHAFLWIVRNEGVGSLYNGLRATLFMSVPATVVYFSAYDELKARLDLSPGVNGAAARVFAVTCVAPFELLRTRQQSETRPQGLVGLYRKEIAAANSRSMSSSTTASSSALASSSTTATSTSTSSSSSSRWRFPWFLWRGLSPTLWRDVPFSGIYWMIVEGVKASPRVLQMFDVAPGSTQPLPLGMSFVAACSGGAVAAVITHPFDVVKTRRQVFEFARDHVPTRDETNTFKILHRIVTKDGMGGLFVGLMPRVAKIIPSTAIMLTTYDGGKRWMGRWREGRG